MHRWFPLKYIQSGSSNRAVAQGCCQRRVIDNAAARDIDQRCGGLHHCEFGGTNGVVRCRRIGQHQHQVVRCFKQFFLADISGLAVGLKRRI